MKQKAYFKINSKDLVLEEVLVDFNGIPIFFVCKDYDEQYYVALCYDIDNEQYIVVKTNINTLFDLLNQKITMRNLFLSETEFWDITMSENIENDYCVKKDISKIEKEVLPYEGEYFEIVTKTQQGFLNKIKNLKINSITTNKTTIPLTTCNTIENESLYSLNWGNMTQLLHPQRIAGSIKMNIDLNREPHYQTLHNMSIIKSFSVPLNCRVGSNMVIAA